MDFADFKVGSLTTLTINLSGLFENLIIAVVVGLLAPLLKWLVLLLIKKIKKDV